MKKHTLTLITLTALGSTMSSSATVIAFNLTPDGTPIGSSGITFGVDEFVGGTATSATTGAQHGQNDTFLGGNFTGSVLNSTISSDTTLTTRILSTSRPDIDNNTLSSGTTAGSLNNFIGFAATFSEDIPIFSIGLLDFDGVGNNANGFEIATVFGFDSSGNLVEANSVTLSANSNVIVDNNVDINFTGSNGATTENITVASTGVSTNGIGPNNIDHQAIFNFDGQEVTELFFAFGVTGTATANNAVNNSGVTGITVINSIPEPSSLALFGLAGLVGLTRRKRA